MWYHPEVAIHHRPSNHSPLTSSRFRGKICPLMRRTPPNAAGVKCHEAFRDACCKTPSVLIIRRDPFQPRKSKDMTDCGTRLFQKHGSMSS
ncbi:hypothetical protein LshimejAT787_0505770 [Lyophyllum shimeji]|uniref:Uncharacterized protein n=1 Tax=Lyophyllum shimeji TaxID=47721 RepID=A0A9P3UMV6_LYOSH|nr:hypothetical protein LshimejAT787_0505770 [Lyophyllum shimeji]